MKQFLEAGKIVGTHGVRGELRVEPWCDSAAFLKGLPRLYWESGEELKVTSSRVHKSLLLVQLEGIDTLERADTLRGRVLYLNREDVSLPEGRYFIQDIIGLAVRDADTGAPYGTLTDVMRTGANDVYQVTAENGKDYLIPAVPAVVIAISPAEGLLTIRPIEGIFDDAD